jgi:cell division protein FtsB
VLAFVAIVLVVDALAGNRGLLETMRARRQFDEVAADLERTRRDNDRLREEIRRLRDDPATIESVAREELGLIRQDEMLFIIHDSDKPADR